MTIEAAEKIWINGSLIPWEESKVHILTHGLHYGTGAFEGIRCYDTPEGPAVFRLREHLERQERSARKILISVPYSIDELTHATHEVIRANNLDECYIRPTVFRSYGDMSPSPGSPAVDVMVAVWRWGAYLGAEGLVNGIRTTISSWRRHDSDSLPPDAKVTGAYLNSSIAKQLALSAGFEEAIMLNSEGYVCEGSGENIFIVKRGAIITPPLWSGPLPGITRDTIITVARDAGIEVREELVTRSALLEADEIFLTGTAAEVTPVRAVDAWEFEAPGPITALLQERYFQIVKGKDSKYSDWLDIVASTR